MDRDSTMLLEATKHRGFMICDTRIEARKRFAFTRIDIPGFPARQSLHLLFDRWSPEGFIVNFSRLKNTCGFLPKRK